MVWSYSEARERCIIESPPHTSKHIWTWFQLEYVQRQHLGATALSLQLSVLM